MTKLLSRPRRANQAHFTNRLDDPLLLSSDLGHRGGVRFRYVRRNRAGARRRADQPVACLSGRRSAPDGCSSVLCEAAL